MPMQILRRANDVRTISPQPLVWMNWTLLLFAFFCLMPLGIDINANAACGGGITIKLSFMTFSLGGGSCGIADAICTVVGWFKGSLGAAIASLTVIFLGIQAFFGKITWGTVVLYTVGIFSIFGAGDIVSAFTGVAAAATVCGTS